MRRGDVLPPPLPASWHMALMSPQRWGRWGVVHPDTPFALSVYPCTRPPAPASFRTSLSVMWKMEYGAIDGTDNGIQISDEMFFTLCRLDSFGLKDQRIDQSTLAGYLACNQTNLRDATRIAIPRGKCPNGEGSAPGLERLNLGD